jgi:hypothetical protein
MIFESEGIVPGAIVFFKYSESKGYVPAIVETVFPKVEGESEPDLAVVAFVTGYHAGAEPRSRVKHRSEIPARERNAVIFHWLRLEEVKALEEEKISALEKAKAVSAGNPEQLPKEEHEAALAGPKGRPKKTAK